MPIPLPPPPPPTCPPVRSGLTIRLISSSRIHFLVVMLAHLTQNLALPPARPKHHSFFLSPTISRRIRTYPISEEHVYQPRYVSDTKPGRAECRPRRATFGIREGIGVNRALLTPPPFSHAARPSPSLSLPSAFPPFFLSASSPFYYSTLPFLFCAINVSYFVTFLPSFLHLLLLQPR